MSGELNARETFEALYRRLQLDVFRFCLGNVHDRVLAEDLTEETFARALRSYLSRPVPDDVVRVWLLRIAHNSVIDHWRRERRWATVISGLRQRQNGALDVEDSAMSRQDLRDAIRAVASLPRRERELVSLHVDADLTYAEVGMVVGLSDDGARRATHRVTHKLRSMVESGTNG